MFPDVSLRSYVLLGTSVEAPCPPMVRRKMRLLRVGAAQGSGWILPPYKWADLGYIGENIGDEKTI